MKKDKRSVQSKKSQPVNISNKEIRREEKFPIHHKAGILLGLIAFALYSNTIGFGYVLDDSAAVVQNRFVQNGIAGIPDILKTDFWYFHGLKLGYYRPLPTITFAIEHELFKSNPQISHFINVFIFAFSGYLLFILLSKIFRTNNFLFPFGISLLFIAHPIHTEVVANIKSRDELLSYLNILLTIWFSLKYYESKKIKDLFLSLLFFYLGMLSKETAMVGIALVPVILYFMNRIAVFDAAKKAIPYVLALILFLVQKKTMMGTLSGMIPDDIVNYPYTGQSIKIPTALLLFGFSLKLLLIPHPLRYDYSFNQIPGIEISHWAALLGLVLFVAGIVAIFKYYKTRSPFVLGLIIFYTTLVPALAFTILRGGIFAERFLFFPSLGFCIVFVAAISSVLKINFKEKIQGLTKFITVNASFAVPLLIIAALYSVKTFSRNFVWKDEITLFTNDIKTGENSVQNLRHYGTEMMNKAIREQDVNKKQGYAIIATGAFRKALVLHPRFGEIYNQLGALQQEVFRNLDSAKYYFTKGMETAPGLVMPYFNMGVIYQIEGKYAAASYYYNEAINKNPEYQSAVKARDDLKAAYGLDVRINPLTTSIDTTSVKDSKYYYNTGNYHASHGDYAKASEQFKQAVALDPTYVDALVNLANCYGMLKQYDLSISTSEKLLGIDPNNIQALQNLAITYKSLGNNDKAQEYERKANALKR